VLSGAGLRDDAPLLHALGEQRLDRRKSEGLVAEVGASRWRRKARNLEQVGSLGETGKPVSATHGR
jgi:hypothetical protein